MPFDRWGDTEPAPEFEVALRKAGLPVASCVRQRHEPFWVRTSYSRKLTADERVVADRVKAAVKAGTLDALMAKLHPPEPEKQKPPSRWDNSESLPELADEMRKAGLPVDWCERMTQPPHWVRTHFTRKPTDAERNKAYAIRHNVANGNPPPDKPKPVKTTKPPAPLPPVKLHENYGGDCVQLLAAAVIETAVKDARAGYEEAVLFLCADEGPWATSRDAWAIVAGMDTDLLHEFATATFAA